MSLLVIVGAFFTLVFSLFFIVGVVGFGPGPTDYSYDLPGGYQLVRSSAHEIDIIPKEGWDPRNPPLIIPAKVVEVAFDDRYILAKRYKLKPAYPGSSNSYEIPDETKVEYYILDTLTQKMYVCLNADEFNNFRDILKVPATLKLKDVASFKAHGK
ncbi:MAG: hypothetical protein BAA01_07425 [Bacillus thermozeamaize]|uniref:Uncharacterized protein n=1 Tax=Bacillus thermozeamaize TaxID=230954 RepID=A0A1Y3Q2N3_9BACI|nr:MAG: hypothetical protein BAA01_07425 [Bacillus thermozeamaize]